MAKQNVKYDTATGKVYEELGCSSSAPSEAATGAASAGTLTTPDYSAFPQTYSTYPYTAQASQYMGSFGNSYSSPSQFNPYDRCVFVFL